MSTHNICFCGYIKKIFCGYPLLSGALSLPIKTRSQSEMSDNMGCTIGQVCPVKTQIRLGISKADHRSVCPLEETLEQRLLSDYIDEYF